MPASRSVPVEPLVEAVRAFFVDCGLDCSVRYEPSGQVRADATIALRASSSGGVGSRQRFAVHVMGSVRLAAVLAAAAESSAPALIVAPWISPTVGMRLRRIGIAYVDGVGNASVRFGTVLIEVSGRPRSAVQVRGAPATSLETTGEDRTVGVSRLASLAPQPPAQVASLAPQPPAQVAALAPQPPLVEVRGAPATSLETTAGPTGVRRSGRLLTPANRRVIETLLREPALERAPLRELAVAAGVSLGQAHKSVSLLAEAGYHRDRLDQAQRTALAGVLEAIGALGEG